MRVVMSVAVALSVGFLVACGGDDETPTSSTTTTSTGATGTIGADATDEEIISSVAEEWAHAYALEDGDTYCPLTSSDQVSTCQTIAGGNPSAYQAGYLNATVTGIQRFGDEADVFLTNGCQIKMEDEGEGDWRVANSGGSLAKDCDQGVGN